MILLYESRYCRRKNTDAISEEDFLKWLEDLDDKIFNLSKICKWGPEQYGLGSDVSIAYYVKKYFKGADVEILTKKDVSLKRF